MRRYLGGEQGGRSTSSQKLEIHKKQAAAAQKGWSMLSEQATSRNPIIRVKIHEVRRWPSALRLNSHQVLSASGDQSEPLIQYLDLLHLLSVAIIDTIIHQPGQRYDLVSWTKRKQFFELRLADRIGPFYNLSCLFEYTKDRRILQTSFKMPLWGLSPFVIGGSFNCTKL